MVSGCPSFPRPLGSQSYLLKPKSVHVTPPRRSSPRAGSSPSFRPRVKCHRPAPSEFLRRGRLAPILPSSAQRPLTGPPGPRQSGHRGHVSRKPRPGRFPSRARPTHLRPAPPRVLTRRGVRLRALAPPPPPPRALPAPPPPPRSQQLAGKAGTPARAHSAALGNLSGNPCRHGLQCI